MEHRLDLRIKTRLPILLATTDGIFPGVTSELGFEGALVQLDVTCRVRNEAVQLCFEPDDEGVSIPALIVRQDGNAIGLMFGRYAPEVDQYLIRRLSDAIDNLVARQA